MRARRLVSLGIIVFLVVLLFSVATTQFLNQPVAVTYVETESMIPTLYPDDGLLVLPSAIAGSPERGDIIVFEATVIQGGGLTTHRVVEETDRGYITKGDNNPFPDQGAGEPPVRDTQIKAVAVSLGGEAITIPNLGVPIQMVTNLRKSTEGFLGQNIGSFLFGSGALIMSIALLLWDYLEDKSATRELHNVHAGTGLGEDGLVSISRRQKYVLASVAILLAIIQLQMMVPAGTTEYSFVASETDTGSPSAIKVGESQAIQYESANEWITPVTVVLESTTDRIVIEETQYTVGLNSQKTVSMTLNAPDEIGFYRGYMTEHRYPTLLPPQWIIFLHRVHPWLAAIVIQSIVAIFGYVTAKWAFRETANRRLLRNTDGAEKNHPNTGSRFR